jgi:hypothetical protein
MVIWMMLENAKPYMGTIDCIMINQVIDTSTSTYLA